MVDWKEVLAWDEHQMLDVRSEGYSYVQQGMFRHALVYFKALVAIDPDSSYDVSTLGGIYLQLKEYELALECFDHALSLDPTHVASQLNRAKTLLSMGKTREGIAAAKKLVTVPSEQVRNTAEALIMAYS